VQRISASKAERLPLRFHVIPTNQETEEQCVDFDPSLIVKLGRKPPTTHEAALLSTHGFEVQLVPVSDLVPIPKLFFVLHPKSNPRSAELATKLKEILTNDTSLFADTDPKIAVKTLFSVFSSLQKKAKTCAPMAGLVKKIEELMKVELGKMRHLHDQGMITFEYLEHLFALGTHIETQRAGTNGMIVGGKVASRQMLQTQHGKVFKMQYMVIRSNGKGFFQSPEEEHIKEFQGVVRIQDLPVRVQTPEIEKDLVARGAKFCKYGLGHHYCAYDGNLTVEKEHGLRFKKAQGRVMMDATSFKQMNPDTEISYLQYDRCGRTTQEEIAVDESMFFMCWPTLLGFSFAAKEWGEIDLDHVSDIKFEDTAFSSLVLEKEKKQLIQGLATNYQTSFSDIIKGKGGGCIFLLHGAPGTGKTLTAEALAEQLHRPLYSIGVGELGTSSKDLEKSLREILEVTNLLLTFFFS